MYNIMLYSEDAHNEGNKGPNVLAKLTETPLVCA